MRGWTTVSDERMGPSILRNPQPRYGPQRTESKGADKATLLSPILAMGTTWRVLQSQLPQHSCSHFSSIGQRGWQPVLTLMPPTQMPGQVGQHIRPARTFPDCLIPDPLHSASAHRGDEARRRDIPAIRIDDQTGDYPQVPVTNEALS
jgi:hypothetical protein